MIRHKLVGNAMQMLVTELSPEMRSTVWQGNSCGKLPTLVWKPNSVTRKNKKVRDS